MSKHRRRNKQENLNRATTPKDWVARGTPIPPEMLEQYKQQQTPQSRRGPGQVSDKIMSEMETNQSASADGDINVYTPGAPLRPFGGIAVPAGPRQYDFPSGYNIAALPRNSEITSFGQLRSLAALYEGIQLCETVWFDVVSRLEPKVTMKPGILSDGESEEDPKWQKIIQPAHAFLQMIDGQNPLADWMTASVRDILELGQSALWLRQDRTGMITGVDVIDAATIKPLLDTRGRMPRPPYPAYEQFIKGVPAGLYTSDRMLMIRESMRTESIYSTSRVERIILRINQALRKENLDLTRYTDGSIPEGILFPDANSNWTPEECEAYERSWNGLLSGNDRLKVRMRIAPPGAPDKFISTRPSDPQMDFDRYLLNLTVAAFGLTMDEIALTETSNRSVGQTQQAVIYRRVVQPIAHRYGDLFTRVIQSKFDPRLIVTWGGVEEAEDLRTKAETLKIGVDAGALSVSRMAKIMGWPVETQVPPFIQVQGGADNIVLVSDIADQKVAKEMQAVKLEQAKTTLQITKDQVQELDAQVKQSQEQAAEPAWESALGSGTPPSSGNTDAETPPADQSATGKSGDETPPADTKTDETQQTPKEKADALIADAQKRVQVPDLLRAGNAPAPSLHPRGPDGRWIGTGGKDISQVSGMKAAIALDAHMQKNVAQYDKRNGDGAHAKQQATLEARSLRSSQSLSAADRKTLSDHVNTLKRDQVAIARKIANLPKNSPAYTTARNELMARITAETVVLQHLNRQIGVSPYQQSRVTQPDVTRAVVPLTICLGLLQDGGAAFLPLLTIAQPDAETVERYLTSYAHSHYPYAATVTGYDTDGALLVSNDIGGMASKLVTDLARLGMSTAYATTPYRLSVQVPDQTTLYFPSIEWRQGDEVCSVPFGQPLPDADMLVELRTLKADVVRAISARYP